VLQQRDEHLRHGRSSARAAASKPGRPHEQRRAHDLARQCRPDRIRPTEHRQLRERLQRRGRNGLADERAEAGRDAVRGPSVRQVGEDDLVRRCHPREGSLVELDRGVLPSDADDVRRRQAGAVETHYL
jgi:hypothetical protein